MDFHAERVIAEEFQKFLMLGLVYQGSKPVMWSPMEKTALAEAEVEYHDKESFTVWVKFPVAHGGAFNSEIENRYDIRLLNAKVVIWTTTPWTIPSNKAVVFGKDISYGLYEVTGRPEECWAEVGDYYILADKLADDVMSKARLESSMYRRVLDVPTSVLDELSVYHPLGKSRRFERLLG